MVCDEPPSARVLYEGLEVLFVSPDPDGNKRYARGCVNEALPDNRFLIRLLCDNHAATEVSIEHIRLLPRRETPDFGEAWMKKMSLAVKMTES